MVIYVYFRTFIFVRKALVRLGFKFRFCFGRSCDFGLFSSFVFFFVNGVGDIICLIVFRILVDGVGGRGVEGIEIACLGLS